MLGYRCRRRKARRFWRIPRRGLTLPFVVANGQLIDTRFDVPDGGAKAGETVVFSFIVLKSEAHRDAVNKKVIKEMSAQAPPSTMPFDINDIRRMAYGGFKTIVQG